MCGSGKVGKHPSSEGFALADTLCVHSPDISARHSCASLSYQLELQCHELNSEKQESYVENVKLKMTNDELSRALENTSQELAVAQEQLAMLQEQAARLHQEKEM